LHPARWVIDAGDAVSDDCADGCSQEERALPNSKLRQGANPDQSRLVLLVTVEVARREFIERGPLLAAGRNVLALVLADRTGGRRRLRGRKLAAAGRADEGRHHTPHRRQEAASRGRRRRGTYSRTCRYVRARPRVD